MEGNTMNLLIVLSLMSSFNITVEIPNSEKVAEKSNGIAIFSSDMAMPWRAGDPLLPVYPIVVAAPMGQRVVGVEVVDADYEKFLSNKYVVPTPNPVPTIPPEIKSMNLDETPVEGEVYRHNGFYPTEWVELTSTGHLFGWPVAGLVVNPFRYNPVTGELERLKHLEIQLETKMDSTIYPRGYSRLSAFYLEKFLRSIVINPEIIHIPVNDNASFDYLIITPEDYLLWADSIAFLHRVRGFKAEVRTMEWVESNYSGRDRAEKLRNYLKAAADSGLLFVAIAGDEGPMPSRVAYAMTSAHGVVGEDSIRADLYFSDLDGTWDADNDNTFGEVEDMVDMYPDVFVGRIPAATAYGLKLYYRKLKRYFALDSTDYLGRVVLNGMILWDEPFSPGGVAKEIVDSAAVPDSLDVRKLYEYRHTSSYDTAVAEFRRGEAIYNHNGHGWYYAMWVAHAQRIHRGELDRLGNPHNYGILYTTGCWVGAFDKYSFGEVFTILENTPGIGFIGNSRYGWGSPGNPGFGYSDIFDTEFFKKLYLDSLDIASITLAASKIRFIPLAQWRNVYRWHEYEINLLGDPLLIIHRGRPQRPAVTTSRYLIPGTDFNIRVTYPTGEPVGNAIASLTHDGVIVARELTSSNGIATIHLPDTIPFDSLDLLVHGESIVPTHIRLAVMDTSQSPLITVTNVYVSAEDGRIPEPGDDIILVVDIKNMGNSTAPHASVLLSVDPVVTVYEHSFDFNDIHPGDQRRSIFHGTVSDTISLLHHALGDVIVAVGADTFAYPFAFDIGRPDIHIVSHAVFAGTDSIVDSHEDVRLSLLLKNEGIAPISNGRFELHPEKGAPIVPISMSVDSVSILTDDTIELRFEFSTLDMSHNAEIGFLLTGRDELNHYIELPFSISVGQSYNFEDFEGEVDGWIFRGHWSITDEDAHSGSKSAYCGITGQGYLPNWDDTLISPYFDIPPSPQLSFWLKFETANYGVDGVYVYVQQDTSSYLLDFIGSGGALDSTLAIDVGWAEYSYDLSFLDPDRPARVLFVFRSDSDDELGHGFYVDDVKIGGSMVNDRNAIIGTFSASPNPFSDRTSLTFDLKRQGDVTLEVFDMSGRLVKTIDLGLMDRGRHSCELQLSGLPQGTFIVRVKNDGVPAGHVIISHIR